MSFLLSSSSDSDSDVEEVISSLAERNATDDSVRHETPATTDTSSMVGAKALLETSYSRASYLPAIGRVAEEKNILQSFVDTTTDPKGEIEISRDQIDAIHKNPSNIAVCNKRKVKQDSDCPSQLRSKKVKDKVRQQRLKGQSGIGSDFRTWKSDAEMVMRQQYD